MACDHTVGWTAGRKCHCAADDCHQTFSTPSNFDKHRVNGACVAPQSVGLELNERGVWRQPGETDFHDRLQEAKAR